MIENEEFEWNEFIIFASKCLNDDNSSVKQRTGLLDFIMERFVPQEILSMKMRHI